MQVQKQQSHKKQVKQKTEDSNDKQKGKKNSRP